MNMKYIIAVDLGGTITKVGLLRNGELVDYVKMPSRQDLDMTASLPEIENAIDDLDFDAASATLEKLKAVLGEDNSEYKKMDGMISDAKLIEGI